MKRQEDLQFEVVALKYSSATRALLKRDNSMILRYIFYSELGNLKLSNSAPATVTGASRARSRKCSRSTLSEPNLQLVPRYLEVLNVCDGQVGPAQTRIFIDIF